MEVRQQNNLKQRDSVNGETAQRPFEEVTVCLDNCLPKLSPFPDMLSKVCHVIHTEMKREENLKLWIICIPLPKREAYFEMLILLNFEIWYGLLHME